MSGELAYRAVGLAGHIVLSSLMATARWRVLGEEHHDPLVGRGQRVVYVVWHGRMIPAAYYHRNRDMAALISQSRDGEYIARVVRHWGFIPVRGSSSRGAASGVRSLLREARRRHVVLTPDGPRGPRQRMKPGALAVAQLSGLPVLPVSAACSRPLWFDSGWDRFVVPGPFSRIAIAYGAPVQVPRGADPAQIGALAGALEAILNDLTARADAAVAG